MAFNKAKALQEAEKSVGLGKISQAIKLYQDILENDPSDLSLLNTMGDLCVRDKNVAQGLKHFYRLAGAYVQEGFVVKAIAIYKKISKLDVNRVEPLLKLGELYQLQGLGREAREQYLQAVEFHHKRKETDKALDVLRKVVQLDPENAMARSRLAHYCEQTGRKDEAARIHLDAAEAALHRSDVAAAELALKKALELSPKHPQAYLVRARVALVRNKPEEAEKIIASVPDLKADPGAMRLLLEAYFAAHKLDRAERLAVEIYRANPADFAPLALFSTLCTEKNEFDAAFRPLSEVAEELIVQKNTGHLMECLRKIWSRAPQHLPTLKLIYQICDRTGDEYTLPEVLEALGHANVQAGNLQEAEKAYERLANREPENEHYRDLLRQVMQKLGKKEVARVRSEDLSEAGMALTPEPEVAPAPVPRPVDEEAMVREALDNSDLYSRYGLTEKAVKELEKVLEFFPDQLEIHRRIHEICRRNMPERAAQAAETVARILAQQEAAGGGLEIEREVSEQPAATAAEAAPPSTQELEPSQEFPLSSSRESAPVAGPHVPPVPVGEAQFDLSGPAATEASPPAAESAEVDLSEDWETMAAPPAGSATAAPPEAPVFNFEESQVEINFYLENGFLEEAQKAVEELERKFPGNEQVAQLRRRVRASVGAGAARARAKPAATTAPGRKPASIPAEAPAQAGAQEWELPEEPASAPPVPPSSPAGPAPAVPARGPDLLGDLVGDLASRLEGLTGASPPASAAASAAPVSPWSDLLAEMGETGAEAGSQPDEPETHYSLGVAFREMGLLDEAIGEFQKVVKGAGKGKFPLNFLQACSLLAVCFMDKKMPAIAVKWYTRALEAPGLDEEATLALQYDLGVAYEQSGDTRTALEKFTEVYSQNIDYRDVAEKIRVLQQKVG